MDLRPAFIVAQYKSGTSWLLSALSAHPDVRGLREIDIIKATFAKESGAVRSDAARIRGFFGSSAWCRDDLTERIARGLPDWRPAPVAAHLPQSVDALDREGLLRLYCTVRDSDSPIEIVDTFVEVNSQDAKEALLVLKAADQIAVFDHLQSWQPGAPKIAITRDCRDAAISAQHFRQLMAEQNAPWLSGGSEYMKLLRGMASRSQMIADRAEAGELYLLRYEDLTDDFGEVFGGLLRWLGLDHSAALIEEINGLTSFESRTGRERGTEGKGVIRKGAVGEWRDALDEQAKEQAWDIAGDALERLGYTRSGRIEALSDRFRKHQSAG